MMVSKLKNIPWHTLYLFISGNIIILVFLYLRLFLPRKSYLLEYLKINPNVYYLMLYILFIAIHAFIVFSFCYNSYKRFYNIDKNSILVIKLRHIIQKIYWEPLEYIFNLCAPDLPYSGKFILHYISLMVKSIVYLKSYIIVNLITILFLFLPRILSVCVFFIEVYIYNKIHLFLYTIPFLLIPVMYKIFIKLCIGFYARNVPEIEKDLLVVPKENCIVNGNYYAFNFSLKDHVYKGENFDHSAYVKELEHYWIECYHLKKVSFEVNFFIEKYEKYVTLFCSSIYLFVGIYKLWFVFF